MHLNLYMTYELQHGAACRKQVRMAPEQPVLPGTEQHMELVAKGAQNTVNAEATPGPAAAGNAQPQCKACGTRSRTGEEYTSIQRWSTPAGWNRVQFKQAWSM